VSLTLTPPSSLSSYSRQNDGIVRHADFKRTHHQILLLTLAGRGRVTLSYAWTFSSGENWIGAAFLGNAWTMTKGGRTATCALFSHQFGWELRLTIVELVRTQVCRATDDVLRVQEEWRTALIERGYVGDGGDTVR
jgi:hypothetical protein